MFTQTVILLVGLIVAYNELHSIKTTTSGNTALQLFEDIRSDRVFKNNPNIIWAIENNQPILKENGGKFDEGDLDNYLSFFDWIYAANQGGILSDEMVYNFHKDLLQNSYNNPEIRNYINTLQKESLDYYAGLVELVRETRGE